MKRIFITVYILLVGILFTLPHGVGHIINGLFEEEVAKAKRDISKGTFFLIAERLAGMDPEAQKQELEALSPRFGYPLGLYRLDEIQVDQGAQKDFLAGLIVEEEDRHILVMRLGDQVLTMGGPFPDEWLHHRAVPFFLLILMILLVLPALAWTIFFNWDVKKMENTAARFMAGDYNARVRVSKISSLTHIARGFNINADKAQRLITSQKDLVNSVSHEIRTPLARIKFSLEMAGEDVPRKPGTTDYMAEIGQDVQEIETLVDEMLTYAKFEQEPEISHRLSNHELVSWLSGLVRREQTGAVHPIHFKTLPETFHFIARFEPVYLGWAVRNLIRNGVKYAATRVEILFEPGPDRMHIHVDDDGPGIPEEVRDKIFEPFYRMDGSRSRDSGGYGLGLAIAKRITRWHGGTIIVGQSPLQGARFTMMLPVTQEFHLQPAKKRKE